MSLADGAVHDGIAPPEPDLTPAELVARSEAIWPSLVERQAETEERTVYAPDTHEAFERAGFYRTLVPRRFGGYEFTPHTFAEVIKNLARGCPSTAWGVCLASHHAMQVGAFWPESAQKVIFGSGDFRAASVSAPAGSLRPVDGGWSVEGLHRYASGSPYSTHYMGQALPVDQAGTPSGPPALFVAPRSTYTVQDDWGRTLGLKGSGSNSVLFEGGVIPADHVLENTLLIDVDVSEGTPGYRLHGNPLYAGRVLSLFSLNFGALLSGMALGALDEYESFLKTKKTQRPPTVIRAENAHYQRWTGKALAKIRAAEAMVAEGADRYLAACEAQVSGTAEFTPQVDLEIQVLGREAMWLTWNAMQETIFRTAGSSAAEDGQRMQRVWRDMCMAWGHAYNVFTDMVDEELGGLRLGVAR